MGLNFYLYDLRTRFSNDWREDVRFDFSRHGEDYAFARWLNEKNAIFTLIGNQML